MNTKVGSDVSLFVGPPLSIENYARCSGLSVSTVRGQIQKGYLPTIKVGKYNMINTYALAQRCIVADQGE